jgi:hypothetical protein
MITTALLLAACCAEPPVKALDLALRLGPTYALGGALPNAVSDERLGMEAALQLHYRTRYLLTPFLEGGYARLGAGSAPVPRTEPGGPGMLSVRMDAWHLTAGLTYTLWRAHLGVAMGFYDFGLKSQLAGVSSSTHAASLGLDAVVGVRLFEAPRFFAAFEVVSHNGLTADLHYVQAALSIHGDALRW